MRLELKAINQDDRAVKSPDFANLLLNRSALELELVNNVVKSFDAENDPDLLAFDEHFTVLVENNSMRTAALNSIRNIFNEDYFIGPNGA
jgi:hypothetical protein